MNVVYGEDILLSTNEDEKLCVIVFQDMLQGDFRLSKNGR